MKSKIFTLILAILPILFFAQNTQTVRGSVIDLQSEMPLIGVAVEIIGTTPRLGAATNENGEFFIKNVPIGRRDVRFSYLGFEPMTVPNLVISAGKEVVLNVKMQESTVAMSEIVIVGKVEKDRPQNEMAAVSARQFSLEEVSRFSGGTNDVSRLVTSFAGVSTADDSRNDIVIRGNSPTGVLWRLEGVPMPNPNHFSTLGTTGGPVSALNPNLIANSDFLTSAFPAEYGNATAGVFDIGFRAGNREKHEFTGQFAAFSGFEAMAEGPINKAKTGSYIIAARYSFVELAALAGINVGTSATPAYKDLSFKLDFANGKYGKFSIFGIGGLSDIAFLGAKVDTMDLFGRTDRDAFAKSQLGLIGVRHNLILDEKTFLRTVISANFPGNSYREDDTNPDGVTKQTNLNVRNKESIFNWSTIWNRKMSPKLTVRAGGLATIEKLDYLVRERRDQPNWQTLREFDGAFGIGQIFGQANYRFAQKWTLNAGLHGQIFTKNNTYAIEPRGSIGRQIGQNAQLTLGYGLHSQTQPLPIFFFVEQTSPGVFEKTNENLGLTRSHHFVLGFDQKLGKDWRLKAEIYQQLIRNVPIEKRISSFSILNAGADFIFPEVGSLENKGTGSNRGLELTIEKFFSQGFYALVTTSIFDSKYKGSDGISRKTAFANDYVFNFLAGKEFKIGKTGRTALTFDTKFTVAGGRPYTPIDLAKSQFAKTEIKDETRAFSQNFDQYLKLSTKFGIRTNSKRRQISQIFALDFNNVTSHKNIFVYRYNEQSGQINEVLQLGFFPDILWRIQF
jgi:CarboxypepD_reg-like domain/TonB-dependent Receptor Plug Domain